MTYAIVIILILMSALFSGLTLGFFSLDVHDLKRKAKLGDKAAKKVYRIRKDGNLLLCTLLVGNVAVNSALSIFLGTIASGVMAGIMATVLIVIFGEIIPQAAFTRYALILGSKLAWLVRIFIIILFPICRPIGWALDKVLGAEMPTVYSKKELRKIIEEHEDSSYSDIDTDEERILKGALSFSEKIAEQVMTPRSEIFGLSFGQKIDNKLINSILKSSHSRIPVYKKSLDEIVGVAYTRELLTSKGKKVGDIAHSDVIFTDHDKKLDSLLTAFQKARRHLFVVLGKFGATVGVVTLEDVLEEIIGAEIIDEDDRFDNLRKRANQRMKKRKLHKI